MLLFSRGTLSGLQNFKTKFNNVINIIKTNKSKYILGGSCFTRLISIGPWAVSNELMRLAMPSLCN